MHTSPHRYVQIRERIRPVKPSYEPGMKISYDPTSRRVVVAFRGRITALPETYDTEDKGVRAGEAFCRRQGWFPQDADNPKRSFFKSWV